MAKSKKKKQESEVKTRAYRLLMYPDNPVHQKVILDLIDMDIPYLGVWHRPQNGLLPEQEQTDFIPLTEEQMETELQTEEQEIHSTKKHAHILLYFKNPVYWGAVCKRLGLVDLLGAPDYQFCRAIGYDDDRESAESFAVYMLHKNTPEKEQYSVSEYFGTKDMIQFGQRAVVKYSNRKVDMCEAVLAALLWLDSMPKNKVITMREFGFAACSNEWFKGASSPIVRGALEEHNYIAREKNKEDEKEFPFGSVVNV